MSDALQTFLSRFSDDLKKAVGEAEADILIRATDWEQICAGRGRREGLIEAGAIAKKAMLAAEGEQ